MGDLADCKACCNGVLLPFGSPQGFVVYFCTNCRRRFSGYTFDPAFEGKQIFSEYAVYIDEPVSAEIPPLPESELMDKYRDLLDSNPPQESEDEDQAPYSLPEEISGFA
jgi:hypothetical protein